MDVAENFESTGIPELVLKLCNHLAKNKEGLPSKLYKIAFNFLSYSPSVSLNTSNDEVYIVTQTKQLLMSQSKEKVEQFELMYSNICKSSILQHRCATLSFVLNLAKTQKDVAMWDVTKELDKFHTQSQILKNNSQLQLGLSSASSQDSVKHIFDIREKKKFKKSQSNVTRVHSQTTTSSSFIWSKSDIPTYSKLSSLTTVTEQDLLQDVIYSLQGIDGKFLRKEPGGLGFTIDPKAGKLLTPIQRGLLERLTGMSFLHKQLKQYVEDDEKQNGIICQALIATLSDELSNYYKTVAILQASMNKDSCKDNSDVTIKRALYIMHEHRSRFEWLAYISEQCSDKKGGALITAIHGFLQHGSKCAQEVSERVLKAVCKPLYIMLSRWLLDGEINDPCNEFFIESKTIIVAERLWHDKYYVRQSMVPSFISMDQAKKILATGKSINFLTQICKDGGQLPGRESLQKLFRTTSAEALFAPEQSIEFHATLENVYKETSLRVLDLLKNKFKLYEHLQSLRRYLLLGQGDFIRHLLELLAPELNKPAENIYGHTLTAILESAIRVTNAQYEDEDTLKRLNISFMSHSSGDMGWDIFSLVYIVDGPIGTIFQQTMPTYQCLFGALWKAKRMEFTLANMRRQQISMEKRFRTIKELKPVMHIIHILTSKMIHFLHQTQYYFLFEVLECSWAEMQNQVNKAECLDDIIVAHTGFLNSIQRGVLLDENSRQLFSHLISVYNFVVNLEAQQEALHQAALDEYNAYMDYLNKINGESGFGTTSEEEIAAKVRRATFHQFLNVMKLKIKTSAQTYDVIVKNFLELLSKSMNMNLRLLSADDLLFCYRWLLLEMKREFAFEDSLRMLEVLWSSLPADPPEKELRLYDTLFQLPNISTPPISPLVKTPRENPYTKVCALRRQSSSISLSNYNSKKIIHVKRQNHSLDESISKCRNNILDVKFKHQSLDDTALTRSRNKSNDTSPKSPKNCSSTKDDSSSKSSDHVPLTPNSPKSPRSPRMELRPRSVSPLEQKSDSVVLNNRINTHRIFTERSASLSSSMSNLIRNPKKTGHFKELKDKIAAAKLFSSLDRLDTTHSIKEEDERKPRGKMVKNLNEFLNFGVINKNKISDMNFEASNEKPKIMLTKSSFDDSESSSFEHNSSSAEKTRHFSSTSNSCDDTFDETSPDDSQEYFPMTTSVTRELRLELENLDRKVFGDKYVDRFSESPSSEGNSDTKTEKENIAPKVDEVDESEVKELFDKRKNDDIFVWENPLHQTSPNTANKNIPNYTETPDEQADIEYDTPTIVNETSARKTVTPITIINQTSREDIKELVEKVETENLNRSIPDPPSAFSKFNNVTVNGTATGMTNSCEEVTESIKASSMLPPPNEFGGGNPFLMFLCITLLMQHRDHIISMGMDYNEMAMHFDKMVRKHNVIRVLNQARQMYARYIKQHSIAQQKIDSRNEDC